MVSSTGDGIESVPVPRAAHVEHVGQGALVLGVLAMVCALVPVTCEAAWVAALPAVVLAVVSLGIGTGRKRYAAFALLFGWFAFAYSFAMMLWG